MNERPSLTTAPADESPGPLDHAAALERVGGNVDLLGELAALFLEECPKWLAALGRDLLGGDARGLRFTAHLVRGSVGAFGAAPAGEAARRLEASARAGDLAAAAGAYSALDTALRRLTPALAALAPAPEPAA